MSGRTAADGRFRTYRVWDAPTRAFHWINAAVICGSLATGLPFVYLLVEGTPQPVMDRYRTLHLVFGYTFAVNLLIRLAWGFFGNRFARWRAILPGRASLAAAPGELAAMVRRGPHEYLGRSPLSRLSNTGLFLLLIVQAGTGLGREWTPFYYPLAAIHLYSAYALVALIAVHVAGAVLSEVRQRSGVVSAMFSGQKLFAGRPLDAEDDL